MPYRAPNGYIYENKKAYLRSRKAMFAALSKNGGKRSSNRRQRKPRKVKRPKIKTEFQGKAQNPKRFKNDIRTVSNDKDIRVVHSYDAKESRRKFQNNTIDLEDPDANIRVTIIDRQNALKPKKAKYITAQKLEGDYVITEYGADKRKVAEMHVIPSNIRPEDLERSKSQLAKTEAQFNEDSKRLSNSELANTYNLGILREIAKEQYPEGLNRPNNLKNEKLWLVRKIKKKSKEKEKIQTPT